MPPVSDGIFLLLFLQSRTMFPAVRVPVPWVLSPTSMILRTLLSPPIYLPVIVPDFRRTSPLIVPPPRPLIIPSKFLPARQSIPPVSMMPCPFDATPEIPSVTPASPLMTPTSLLPEHSFPVPLMPSSPLSTHTPADWVCDTAEIDGSDDYGQPVYRKEMPSTVITPTAVPQVLKSSAASWAPTLSMISICRKCSCPLCPHEPDKYPMQYEQFSRDVLHCGVPPMLFDMAPSVVSDPDPGFVRRYCYACGFVNPKWDVPHEYQPPSSDSQTRPLLVTYEKPPCLAEGQKEGPLTLTQKARIVIFVRPKSTSQPLPPPKIVVYVRPRMRSPSPVPSLVPSETSSTCNVICPMHQHPIDLCPVQCNMIMMQQMREANPLLMLQELEECESDYSEEED